MKRVDLDQLGMGNMREVREALKTGTVQVLETATVIPLLVGETRIGLIYLDYQVTDSQELELLQVFANQAAVAIQNTPPVPEWPQWIVNRVICQGLF